MKIALAQINPIIGALRDNCAKIVHIIEQLKQQHVDLVVFPEMALCGYPPEDLLQLPSFITAMSTCLHKIRDVTSDITVVVGCVRSNPNPGEKQLFNSAALIQDKKLLGFRDKILLPDYDVFSERRYFEPGPLPTVWNIKGKKVAVTICEDIWQHAHAVEYSKYFRDPIQELQPFAPDVLINLSASPYFLRRHETRLRVCKAAAQTLRCPVLFCNQIGGNDSLIFDGYSLYLGAKGTLLEYAAGFEEALLVVDLEEQTSQKQLPLNPIADLFQALVLGVRDYFHKLGWKKCCLGLSGGIDSAVAAVIASCALGKENVLALALPSRYSTDSSFADAQALVNNLGIEFQQVSIEQPFESFLNTLAPCFEGNILSVTEENLQARIRGILLMAFANQWGYLLLSTGNKSEMAMGYATLYGDMCGALGVLSDVTKEQVYALAHYINREHMIIPTSVLVKPPSAELRFNQKDTDSLPEYPVVDRILQDYVEEHLSPEEIAAKNKFSLPLVKELVRKIHLNEYKRRQAPPGLRVTKKSFTIGRRFPIVQRWNLE